MKIEILSPGRFGKSELKPVFQKYIERCNWDIRLKEIVIKECNKSIKIRKESKLIVDNISLNRNMNEVILLDINAEIYSTMDLVNCIRNNMMHRNGSMKFIIGGVYGVERSINSVVDRAISLGRMTWPHLLARVMLVEQIYRVHTIIFNHPYHN